MSSNYVAKFLNASRRKQMESLVAEGTAESLFEEWLDDYDDMLCIGDSTDAWVYMACRSYLAAKDCLPDTLATPFGKQLFTAYDMIDLFIPHEQAPGVIDCLVRLKTENDDPLPTIRKSLVEWRMDGYVEELDSIPDIYFEFLASFEQHMRIAVAQEKSLLVFVPY